MTGPVKRHASTDLAAVAAAAMLLLTLFTVCVPTASAEDALQPQPSLDREAVRDAVLKGLAWLAGRQGPDGGWEGSCGVTALVLVTFTQAGFDYTNQTVQRGLQFLRRYYNEETGLIAGTFPVYEDVPSFMVMLGAGDPQDAPRIPKAVDALLAQQYTGDNLLDPNQTWYIGGWPNYAGIPDTSNGQFAAIGLMTADLLDPTRTIPLGVWDGTIKIAKQSQNWPDVNNFTWAHDAGLPSYGDGGFVYNSLRSRTLLGEQMFESYGSITAAGLVMYLASGHGYDNPETAAARAWLEREYTLTENPRLEGKGLYYYLWSMSRMLAMSAQGQLVDGSGKLHDARSEIAAKFVGLQRPAGGWDGNPFSGWREEEPELATMYALWALEAGYLMVPNPRFELEVTGASRATFVGVDGAVLGTDAAKGLTVTASKLTSTDPETFRKVWVLLDGTEGATATVSAKGTWGQGRTAQTSTQVRLGELGASVFSATGAFAGPFGINLQPSAGGPQLTTSAGGRLELRRGEANIVNITLSEATGLANVTGADLVLDLPSGAVADAGAQHVTVPKGGSTTVELTVYVPADAAKGRAGSFVVSSNNAPPVLIEVHYLEEAEDGDAPPELYWVMVLVLFVVVVVLIALPVLAKRRGGDDGARMGVGKDARADMGKGAGGEDPSREP